MPRRAKTTLADDLIELVSRLPWWVGVVLALVGYLVLHGVATAAAQAHLADTALIHGHG